MDLYIWQWVVRLLNKIKLGHGQKSLKNTALTNAQTVAIISDPRRGRYMVLLAFIFLFSIFFFLSFFFFPPRFCTDHISGTVTLRDSKLSVLLGPAV